MSMSTHSYLRP